MTDLSATLPLVSVGLPVYNGMPHLRAAVASLLRQSYAHLEIVICDNASSDGTEEYCRAVAQVHGNVKYVRSSDNIGPLRNFQKALTESSGKYFMWASHDDAWNANYVASLVHAIDEQPKAVLATPAVLHVDGGGGLRNEPPDRPAPGGAPFDNLKVMFDDHAASWIYGLYRRDWLIRHVDEWGTLPVWGFDIMWLADVCLRFQVVGNQDAILYKRWRPSAYAPKNARQAVAFWWSMYRELTRIIVRRTSGSERQKTLLLAWTYVYRTLIRRPNPLRTAWRIVRMTTLAAIASIPDAAAHVWRRSVVKRQGA